jgi:serine/threonine protein kinase
MANANQRIGEYVLDEKIGGGTFGEVWRAHHHVWTDQLVAVKLPTDARYVRNLQKQGIAVHNIIHPNVVRAIGCDPYADPPYLTMEYVPGTSLRPLIVDKRLTIPEAIAVLGHVLCGLKCAHEKGLLHLDIKPENILIHERALRDGFGLPGIVKITDFGVGAAAATTAAESIAFSDSLKSSDGKNLVGTLAYIAPEQRDGGAPDQTADLYACGVVLYEMLTGERPAGMDLPSDVNPTVPKFLDDVFRRAYSRRDKRFASADEFLNGLASGSGAAAKPTPTPGDVPHPQQAPSPTPMDTTPSTESPPPIPNTSPTALVPCPAATAEIPVDSNLIAFDEISKKAITDPGELKAAFRHLYELRQVSGDEINVIRKRLTMWADMIPHHKISDFGQRIKIDQATVAPYYIFTLRTQYESRKIERKEEPYRGARVPALVTNEGNIRIWAYPFALVDDFTPAGNDYRIEDSQEVQDCHPCKATGKVTCKRCAGRAKVDCPTCGGRGNVPCPGCGGRGVVTKYRQEVRFRNRTEYRTVTKYHSHVGGGRSWQEPYAAQEPYTVQEQYTVDVPYQEPCPGCAGRGIVTCQTCNGTREVRCENCLGTGQVTCGNCNGQGKVVSFLLIHDSFEPVEESRPHPNPNLRLDCAPLLDVTKDYHVLLFISHPVFSTSITDSLDNASLKELISDAIESSKSPCSPTKRVIKQSINIRRASVVLLKYTYDGEEHELCLCGSQLQVNAPRSPISKVTEGIFHRAVKLLDTEEIAAGLKELRRTFEMGQRDDKARSLLEALRAKLSGSYMTSAATLSKEGLWPDSLYYSDRAKVLFPRSPAVAQHEVKIKRRVAILHLGPPIGIGIAAIILAVLLNNPQILVAAAAAVGAGVACQLLLGLKIRGTVHAFAHSSMLSAALAVAGGLSVCSETPTFGLVAVAIILIVDVILFKGFRRALLRSDPPEAIGGDSHVAIERIGILFPTIGKPLGPIISPYLPCRRTPATLSGSTRRPRRTRRAATRPPRKTSPVAKRPPMLLPGITRPASVKSAKSLRTASTRW